MQAKIWKLNWQVSNCSAEQLFYIFYSKTIKQKKDDSFTEAYKYAKYIFEKHLGKSLASIYLTVQNLVCSHYF